MGNPTDLRKGAVIMYNGKPHAVMSTMHRTPGRRLGFVQTVLRNLETNSSTAVKFKSTDNVDFCSTVRKELDFSYREGDEWHFMDSKTYEDTPISASTVGEDGSVLHVEYGVFEKIGLENVSGVFSGYHRRRNRRACHKVVYVAVNRHVCKSRVDNLKLVAVEFLDLY